MSTGPCGKDRGKQRQTEYLPVSGEVLSQSWGVYICVEGGDPRLFQAEPSALPVCLGGLSSSAKSIRAAGRQDIVSGGVSSLPFGKSANNNLVGWWF